MLQILVPSGEARGHAGKNDRRIVGMGHYAVALLKLERIRGLAVNPGVSAIHGDMPAPVHHIPVRVMRMDRSHTTERQIGTAVESRR